MGDLHNPRSMPLPMTGHSSQRPPPQHQQHQQQHQQNQHPQQPQQQQRQQQQQQQRQQKQPQPQLPQLRCNVCRRPPSTRDICVGICGCFFCHDCAERRFKTSSNCPSCDYLFKQEQEIHKIHLGPPRSSDFDHRKPVMELLFAQASPSDTNVNLMQMYKQLRRQSVALRDGTMFVLKQLHGEINGLSKELAKAKHIIGQSKACNADLQKSNLNLEASRDEAVRQLQAAREQLIEKNSQMVNNRKGHQSMGPSSGGTVGRTPARSMDGRGPNVQSYSSRRVSDVGTVGQMPNNVTVPPPRPSRQDAIGHSGVDHPPLTAAGVRPNGGPNYRDQMYNVVLPTPANGLRDSRSNIQEANLHGRAQPSSGGSTVNPSTNFHSLPYRQEQESRYREHEKERRLPREPHRTYVTSEHSRNGMADTGNNSQRHYHSQGHSSHIPQQLYQQSPQASSSSVRSNSSQNPYNLPMPTTRSSPAVPSTHPHGRPEVRQKSGSCVASVASTGTHSSGGGQIRNFNAPHKYSFGNAAGTKTKDKNGTPTMNPLHRNYSQRTASSSKQYSKEQGQPSPSMMYYNR